MRIAVVAFLLCFGWLHLLTAETEIENLALRLLGVPARSDAAIIGPHQRQAVIDLLRGVRDHKIQQIAGANIGDSSAYIVLVRLGDRQSMQQIVRVLREADSPALMAFDVIHRSAEPRMIPLLSPDYFRDDGTKPKLVGGDIVVSTLSGSSMELTRRIIKASPRFSPELKAWARAMSQPPGIVRPIFRKWWKTNEALFLAERFEEVKPVWPEGMPTPTPIPLPTPTPELTPTPVLIKPTPTTLPRPSPSASPNQADIPSLSFLVTLLAIPLLAAAFLWYLLSRNRRQ